MSDVSVAADFLRGKGVEPGAFFVLGSGIDLSPMLEDADVIFSAPYADIPGFPQPTVVGHSGTFTAANLGRIQVAIFAGRKHIYEGDLADAIFPSELMALLGAKVGVFTSSMGSLTEEIVPGDLVLLRDILNFGGVWAARLAQLVGGVRRPFLPFDRNLRQKIKNAAQPLGICLKESVAAFMTGPTYETPAEVEMLRRAGAGVVSMSMAPEVTLAEARGIGSVGIAVVTNFSGAHSDHSEVIATAREASRKLAVVLGEFARKLEYII